MCPRTCSHQGTASHLGWGVGMAHHGEGLSPAVPRACPALCQSCSRLPDTVRVSDGEAESHPGAVGPGGDPTGPPGLLVRGERAAGVPAQRWALLWVRAAPSCAHHSPTLTSCGAGGGPGASGGKRNPLRYLQKVGASGVLWDCCWRGSRGGLGDPGQALGLDLPP